MLLSVILRNAIRQGTLTLIDARDRRETFGEGSPHVTMRLTSMRSEFALLFHPSLALGEAYMDGRLVIEDGSLYELIELLARNIGPTPGTAFHRFFARFGRWRKQANQIGRARQNVAHHYDLSPELYDLFLDNDRQYSCAYFRRPGDTLEEAQAQKKRHIAAKLMLDRRGLRVLDIGSGWGGMACYLAETFDADVTGVTLSEEQYAYSVERARRSPAAERIRFELLDYRDLNGPFDRIVSVGMFEHVGKRNYSEFFTKLSELMTEDGIALIHSIGYSDTPAPINAFMRKYIFPGADLPAMSEVFSVVEREGLYVTDLEILRLHYAETLRCWRERFEARRDEVRALYDDRFYRMWEFYLVLCEIGFRLRTNIVFQMQMTKTLDRLPITRDYMFEAENDGGRFQTEVPGR